MVKFKKDSLKNTLADLDCLHHGLVGFSLEVAEASLSKHLEQLHLVEADVDGADRLSGAEIEMEQMIVASDTLLMRLKRWILTGQIKAG